MARWRLVVGVHGRRDCPARSCAALMLFDASRILDLPVFIIYAANYASHCRDLCCALMSGARTACFFLHVCSRLLATGLGRVSVFILDTNLTGLYIRNCEPV